MIYFFTGQPGAGKTVLAKVLKDYLERKNKLDAEHPNQINQQPIKKVFHIDGDELRSLFTNQNYGREGREENIKRAQDIAKFINNDGHDVVVSLVAPYRELREKLKAEGNTVEIYVHTSDIRGRENFHTDEYEPPLDNFININTTDITPNESLINIINVLYELG